MKSWILVKDVKLQFRWEVFNAFNHPTFGNPTGDYGNTVTWGGFGGCYFCRASAGAGQATTTFPELQERI
jgi:hypothetical protein